MLFRNLQTSTTSSKSQSSILLAYSLLIKKTRYIPKRIYIYSLTIKIIIWVVFVVVVVVSFLQYKSINDDNNNIIYKIECKKK